MLKSSNKFFEPTAQESQASSANLHISPYLGEPIVFKIKT